MFLVFFFFWTNICFWLDWLDIVNWYLFLVRLIKIKNNKLLLSRWFLLYHIWGSCTPPWLPWLDSLHGVITWTQANPDSSFSYNISYFFAAALPCPPQYVLCNLSRRRNDWCKERFELLYLVSLYHNLWFHIVLGL